MIVTQPIRPAIDPGAADTAPWEIASWRDALVELLVLAEHGDVVAASSLQGWVAVDPSAAAACAAIRRVVDAVRAA